jgi:serine/threonine protein kinase
VEEFIQNEAKTLKELAHPFICSLGRTFHTPQYAYELVELVEGEDLDKVMERIGIFSSQDCQFYTACIISILEYLFEMSIITRDIKPENFMVDLEGYLKLINMAVAKKVHK